LPPAHARELYALTVNRTPSRPSALLHCLRLLLVALACAAGLPASGEEAIALEKRVKAAYLAKLPGYVTWPESTFAKPDAPLVFGVLGDEQVAAELVQAVAGRDLDGHPLMVRRLKEGDALTNLQVLFVAGRGRLAEAVRATEKQPVLLVSESEGALERGSVVNFMLVSERVKFDIALDAAEKRGLKLSSRLLGVAHNVRPGGSAP
jgi:hypothetical protein